MNILGGIPYQEISTTISTYKVSIKFWQNINGELLKTGYLITLNQYFENFTKNILLCDLKTALKYCLSLKKYTTLKSPSFMFCQNLIETLCVLVVIYISW